MLYPPHSSSYFPHLPYTSNANTDPAPFPPFPQPVLPSGLAPDTSLHPPGTDPYANLGSYPLTQVGFEGQTQHYEVSNKGSYNWVIQQPEPIRYESATQSLHENQVASTSSTSLWNRNLINQSLANYTGNRIPKQPSFVQPVRCEMCKIDCNSKDVYDQHVLGKKHTKNLQMQHKPFNNTSMSSQLGNDISGQMVLGASYVLESEDLEKKRRKLVNGGAATDSVRVCTVCKIACNSQEVFSQHLAGKKHASQAGLIALNPFVAAVRSQYGNSIKRPKKAKVVQSAWCEVCKINCNGNDVYVKHLSGKKHMKNLESLTKPESDINASNALLIVTNPIIGPVENPSAKKGKPVNLEGSLKKAAQSRAPEEDLETKKRKIVESGTEAGAVKTCTVCNVVCNSETVFTFHLAGQKHAAMVKKQVSAMGKKQVSAT